MTKKYNCITNCKIVNILIIVIFSIFLNQCSLLLPFYGIKSPRNEPLEYEYKYLSSLGIDTSFVYRIKKNSLDSLSIKKYALNTYKLKTGAKASYIQIRMYENNGTFIYGWEQCFGNLNYFDIFKTVPISSKCTYLPINKELNLWSDLTLFDIDLKERNNLSKQIRNHAFTIIVYWASYGGYFTKNTLKKVESYVKLNKKADILFIKLNTAIY